MTAVQWLVDGLAFVLLLALTSTRAQAAVTVYSFKAQAQATQVQVTWKTASEVGNAGFKLYRKSSPSDNFSAIGSFIQSKSLGSMTGASYAYDDGQVAAGQTYYYRLESIAMNGGIQTFDAPPVTFGAPTATPTGTKAPTATATLVPSAVPSATRTLAPLTATPTLAASATPSPISTGTPSRQATATRGVTATPATKVAIAVNPSALDSSPTAAAGPIEPGSDVAGGPQGGPAGAPSPEPVVEPEDSTGPATATNAAAGSSRTPFASASIGQLINCLVFPLAGLLGLGAFLFGGLALYLFSRSSLNQ